MAPSPQSVIEIALAEARATRCTTRGRASSRWAAAGRLACLGSAPRHRAAARQRRQRAATEAPSPGSLGVAWRATRALPAVRSPRTGTRREEASPRASTRRSTRRGRGPGPLGAAEAPLQAAAARARSAGRAAVAVRAMRALLPARSPLSRTRRPGQPSLQPAAPRRLTSRVRGQRRAPAAGRGQRHG